jgi:hypothetical protein
LILSDFFDYDKSAYVKDRLGHGHSIGRRYCGESLKIIRLFWEPAFKGRTLASITRNDLKSFSLSIPADKSASYKNSILNAGLIPLGWAYEEGMIPADIGKDFERYGGKAAKRGVLTVLRSRDAFCEALGGWRGNGGEPPLRDYRHEAGGGSGHPGRRHRGGGFERGPFVECGGRA